MSQIYITAALTSLAALAMWNWMVRKFPPQFPKSLLWLAFLICLPMEPLSFYLMRRPLMDAFQGWWPQIFPYLVLVWAPLTEDTFKLAPLLVPAIRKALTGENWAQLALAIGCGFGIGEAWLVAYFVAQSPEAGGHPFYAYGGFLGERLQVCILHAFFTSWALRRWNNKFWLGLLMAMSLHFLANSPIVWIRFLPYKLVWLQVYGLVLLFFTVYAASHLARHILGPINLARILLGRARCPGCSQIYDRPLLAANLGPKRYERCPHCKKWHLTGQEHSLKEDDASPIPDPG
ncbi:MAG: hypothetical protein U0931_40900 [Vulcanimicrobiota bacterium]